MSQSFGELAVGPAQRAITDLYGQIVGLACGARDPDRSTSARSAVRLWPRARSGRPSSWRAQCLTMAAR